MQISSRFTIACHMIILIARQESHEKITSETLAGSIGVNPVIIRKILSQLQKADIITVIRGTGGVTFNHDLSTMSLLDVYHAVESLNNSGHLFSFHENPNPNCEVGRNIHNILDQKLQAIQQAMEQELANTSLFYLVNHAEKIIQKY